MQKEFILIVLISIVILTGLFLKAASNDNYYVESSMYPSN